LFRAATKEKAASWARFEQPSPAARECAWRLGPHDVAGIADAASAIAAAVDEDLFAASKLDHQAAAAKLARSVFKPRGARGKAAQT
jgi:hypothetical protein